MWGRVGNYPSVHNRLMNSGRFSLLYPCEICRLSILGLIAVTFINDHFLKQNFACTLTGKISDVTGTAFFIFLLTYLIRLALAALSRGRAESNERRNLWAAALITYSLFIAINLLPTFSDWVQRLLTALTEFCGLGVSQLTPDRTDLAAIPFSLALVFIIYYNGKQGSAPFGLQRRWVRKVAATAVLLCASFTSLASASCLDFEIEDEFLTIPADRDFPTPAPKNLTAVALKDGIDLSWEIDGPEMQAWYESALYYNDIVGPVGYSIFIAEGDYTGGPCTDAVSLNARDYNFYVNPFGVINDLLDGDSEEEEIDCDSVIYQFDNYPLINDVIKLLDPQATIAVPEEIEDLSYHVQIREGDLIPPPYGLEDDMGRLAEWEFTRVALYPGRQYTILAAAQFIETKWDGMQLPYYSRGTRMVAVQIPDVDEVVLKNGYCVDLDAAAEEGYVAAVTDCTEFDDLRLGLLENPYLTLGIIPINNAGLIDAGSFNDPDDAGAAPEEGYDDAGVEAVASHVFFIETDFGTRATVYVKSRSGFTDYEIDGELICEQCVAQDNSAVVVTIYVE